MFSLPTTLGKVLSMAPKLKGPYFHALDTLKPRILEEEDNEPKSDPGIIFSFLSIFPQLSFKSPMPLSYLPSDFWQRDITGILSLHF